jgi:hypothetical protein
MTPFPRLGAAVVNALPFEIALLDKQGNICWTNEVWRRSAAPAEGSSFFHLWDNDASGTAEGIRAVLEAEQPAFIAEYPNRSPEDGWRCAILSSLRDEGFEGALVIQEKIAAPSKNSSSDSPAPEPVGREQRIQAV